LIEISPEELTKIEINIFAPKQLKNGDFSYTTPLGKC
jgi:hypothetical protein